jgi:branched-chain amino acid transport system ATP-binding protein
LTSALTVTDLVGGYGPIRILHGVSLQVPGASVLGLLGRNGMGKTTLLHTVMGLVAAESGHVEVNGRELHLGMPDLAARAGLGFVPQGRRVFASLTVEEHIRLASATARRRAYGGGRSQWGPTELFDLFPRLADRRRVKAGSLSGGEQQMVAIARALMTNPEILLLDEPSEGLSPRVVNEIGVALRILAQGGLAMLVVEQNLELIEMVAEQVAVLVHGEVAYRGEARELLHDRRRSQELLGVG